MDSNPITDDDKVLAAPNSQTDAQQKVFYNMADNIFTWLPVKPIFKFRSVSKHSMNFPLEKWFCNQHVNNNTDQSDGFPSTFILQKSNGVNESQSDAITLSKDITLPQESLKFLSLKNTRVLASSRGLLFCLHKSKCKHNPDEAFVIFNPITRQEKYIPAPPIPFNYEFNMGYRVIFECNKNDNDFLLVMFIHKNHNNTNPTSFYEAMIYSCESNDWEEIRMRENDVFGIFDENKSVFFDGAIYYLSPFIPSPLMKAYDIRKGTSETSILPDCLIDGWDQREFDLFLFRWGKSGVGVFKVWYNMLDLWVLEDMETKRWRHVREELGLSFDIYKVPSAIWGVRYVDENRILIVFYNRVYEYCFDGDRKFEKVDQMIQAFQGFTTIVPYSCSLRLV